MARYWDEMTMTEIDALDKESTLLVLPWGSQEGHGQHLPVGTDYMTTVQFVAELADRVTGSIILPGVPYGQCSSTRNFPGTISVSFEAVRILASDILERLVEDGFKRIIIISGHAGRIHMSALKLASADIAREYDVKIAVLSDWDLAYELGEKHPGDGHGGAMETARVMAARPELVRELPGEILAKGSGHVMVPNPEYRYPEGYAGDPSKATPEFGREVNSYITDRMLSVIEELMSP